MRLIPKRFSIRTLLVFVTIVALWLAALPLCKNGKIDVIEFNVARNGRMMHSTELLAPFVFHCQDYRIDKRGPATDHLGNPVAIPGFDLKQDSQRTNVHTLYFWWFGTVRKIPFSFDGGTDTRDTKTKRWLRSSMILSLRQ